MKKIFLLATMLLFSASAAFAQYVGLRGGLNIANITNDPLSETKLSGYGGLSFEFNDGSALAFALEMGYSHQGATASLNGTEMDLSLGYLNVIPIMAKIYLNDNVSLDLGPQMGYLLSAKTSAGARTVNLKKASGLKMNLVDLSAAMGLTYNIHNFFIQGRYNLGLTNIFQSTSAYMAGSDKSKNSVIQFGIGCRL